MEFTKGDAVTVALVPYKASLSEIRVGISLRHGAQRKLQGPLRPLVALVQDHGIHMIPGALSIHTAVLRLTKKGTLVTSEGIRFTERLGAWEHTGPGPNNRRLLLAARPRGVAVAHITVPPDEATNGLVAADRLELLGMDSIAEALRAAVNDLAQG